MSTVGKYGRFIEEEGCFELLTNDPPRKWTNVHYNQIGDDELYLEFTNIGDGTTYIRDRLGRRMTLVGWDSKYVYVRDEESGTVFCPGGAPAPQEVTDFSCKYWAAKTEISGTCEGLRATQRCFVPREHPVEVWTVTVQNLEDRPRKISIFGYAMFQLNGCDEEGKGVGKENYSEVMPDIGGVFITNRNVFAPTDRFKGYIIALRDFRAATGYRDFFLRSEFAVGTPRILWGWDGDNRGSYGPDCAGAVQVTIEVPPKGTGRADFILGQASTPGGREEAALPAQPREARRDVPGADGHRDRALEGVPHRHRPPRLRRADEPLPQEAALQLPDQQERLPRQPADRQRHHALRLRRGGAEPAARAGQPVRQRRRAARLPPAQPPAVLGQARLDHAHRARPAEGGRRPVAAGEGGPYFESDETGTVWDHMLRAMRFLAGDLGAHGLCNQHHADWNDGLEATAESGERESVMVTQQLCYGLREVEEIARLIGETAVEEECRALYAKFSKQLNEVAWDGEWYVRTICGDGYRIGSQENKEGKIFLNTQSWAVLSGIAPADRAALCMKSVDEHCMTEIGYRICNPPFSAFDPRVGRMSNSIPGHVENGGCYCHAAGFKGVADCVLGRAEEAWETFVKTAPDNPKNPISVSLMEPFSFTNSYSMCEYVYGRSGYPWRTGTAGWMTVLMIEWILGARRSHAGLLIDPCLTSTVPHARVTRRFRGATYEIDLDNSAGRCKGATSISVDGQKIEGNVLPAFSEGTHKVEVII